MEGDLEHRILMAAKVLKKYGATAVYVFGSAVSGKLHPHSDVDMAVTGIPAEHFYRALGEAYTALGRPLDLVDLGDDTRLARHLVGLKDEGALKRVA
jgi:predicted nucleotidyltransferase